MDVDTPQPQPSVSGASAEQLTGCSERQRFIMELEFIQCLSNPHYQTWLAQNKFLDDPAFKNYLKYLQYWKQPEYAKYIQYPHSLFFLEQLQDEEYCKAIARAHVAEFIHTQQFRFWQSYWKNRFEENTTS